MTFFYIDPALSSEIGHHATACRLITNEVRRRKIPVRILGSAVIDGYLAKELDAEQHFRINTYNNYFRRTDPIAGFLKDFEVARRLTREDLEKLTDVDADDIFLFNSVFPPQWISSMEWLEKLPEQNRPKVFVEFGTDPGLDIDPVTRNFETRDPRKDARSVFYRFGAGFHHSSIHSTMTLFTYEPYVSKIYETLLEKKVETFPWPHVSVTSNRTRAGKRPIEIGFIGHQRVDKGFQFVPNILRELKDVPGIQFTIHDSFPRDAAHELADIRQQASERSNINLDERNIEQRGWQELLDRIDLVICPYDPVRYAASHSGIVMECLCNGIPLVVPSNTILALMTERHGGSAVTFSKWTSESIVEAIRKALVHFDELASRASIAATNWTQTQGIVKFVDRLFAP